MMVVGGLVPRQAADRPAVLTIGSFDGVHLGHAALLSEVQGAARRLAAETVVLTFEPHPRCVLDPGHCPPLLSTLPEKTALLGERGVDRLIVLPFTREVAAWSAEEFCDRLRGGLDLLAIAVGHDFAFGHRRSGDVAFLRAYGARWDVEVHQVRPAVVGASPVSSTRIRGLVGAGDVTAAEELLGHAYCLDGAVDEAVAGGNTEHRPQVVRVPAVKCLPAAGVYAGWIRGDTEWQMAVIAVPEIGTRRPGGADQAAAGPETHRLGALVLDGVRTVAGGPVSVRLGRRIGGGRATAEVMDAQEVAAARSALSDQAPPAD